MKDKKEFVTVSISGVITQIAEQTDVEGYTIGILETFFTDDEELNKMTKKQQSAWVKQNNDRMQSICDFLNGKK